MKRFLSRIGADGWIGLMLALGVSGAAFVFANPHLHPSVWGAYAAATGLRPAAEVQPIVWTLLVRGLSLVMRPTALVDGLPIFGRLALGFLAALAYWGIVRELALLSPRSSRPLRQLAVFRFAASLAAAAFALSDPLWTGAQAFSPSFLTASLLFVGVFAYQRFHFWGRRLTACISAVCLALALLDSILTVFVLLTLGYLMLSRWIRNSEGDDFRRDVSHARWPAFASAVAVFLGGLVLAIQLYRADWTAAGETPDLQQMLEVVVVSYFSGFLREATGYGWCIVAGLAIVPLIGMGFVFKRASTEEVNFAFIAFVGFVIYLIFAFFQFVAGGATSVFGFLPTQLFPGEIVRFWTVFAYAFGFALAICVVAVELFARRIVWRRDAVSSALIAIAYAASTRFRIRWRRVLTASIVLFALSLFAVHAFPARRAALRDLKAYVAAVLDDAAGCNDLFTDGRLDDGLRLEAARRGVTLYPRPMMTRGERLPGLMQRIALDEAELLLAADGGASACLRAMVHDFPQRLTNVAAQVGFEAWRVDLKPLPPAWGTLARTTGTSAARAQSLAAAEKLIAYVAEASPYAVRRDAPLNEALDVVRWRLARMAKYRAEEADRRDDVKTAEALHAQVKRLDEANVTLSALKNDLAHSKRFRSRAMSPREILHLALLRGDCSTCGTLASAVLKSDPENLEAHFAMAISCAANDDYRGAENHFRFCLQRRPNDPALLNNLALTLHNLGKYEDAHEQAIRAQEIAPHVDEIRDTLARIREAEAIVATNGVPNKIRLALVERD